MKGLIVVLFHSQSSVLLQWFTVLSTWLLYNTSICRPLFSQNVVSFTSSHIGWSVLPRGGCDHMFVGLVLQLPMQSVPINTKVVSFNPDQGEVYSIHHYVIKFVSNLRQVCGWKWHQASWTQTLYYSTL